MDQAWLALLPSFITIVSAIWTKKILPSLFLGLLIGSYLLKPSPLDGIETTIDHIVNILSDKNNLQVLLFLYLFSGFISLIRKAGGIIAFSTFVGKAIHTEKSFFLPFGL
jgi:tetracycline resistance efflux pump